MKKIYTINDEFINSRLDRWFRRNLLDVPQSLIEKNIRKGNIRVNNKKNKSSYRLKKNDQILIKNINFKSKFKSKIKDRYRPSKKEISYSSSIFIENNENFVVINKPSGISVQSGTKSKRNILDILREADEFKGCNPYIVHRIDKETTGILVVAKNRKYAQLFTSLFRIRKIHKVYLGIIIGDTIKNKGTLVDNLFHYEGKKKIITKAVTHFSVLDTNGRFSLLHLKPETGRKHQIRKQLLLRGCPIYGDTKYRITDYYSKEKNNLMLHAYKIGFSINDVRYNFTAELPTIFKKFLKEKYLKTSLL